MKLSPLKFPVPSPKSPKAPEAPPVPGSPTPLRSLVLLPLLAALTAGAAAQTTPLRFGHGNPIVIQGEGLAFNYQPQPGQRVPAPAVLSVSGVPGTLTGLRVKLYALYHETADDLDILLVGPGGQSVMLMSDAAPDGAPGSTLTFSATASEPVPSLTPREGTFLPTDHEPGDSFPAPAPAGPYSTSLQAFDGTDPNGDWKLFVVDDTLRPTEFEGYPLPPLGPIGSLAGWVLEFATTTSDQVLSPPNDWFVNRLSLPGLHGSIHIPATGVPPTAEPGEPPLTAGHEETRSLWFSWTAPRTGRLSLRTEGSSYLPSLRLYTGTTLPTLQPVDGFGDFLVQADQTYQIQVAGFFSPTFGNLALSWQLTGSQLGPRHKAHVTSNGSGYHLILFAEGNDYMEVSPYETGDSAVPFLTGNFWNSLYLYDYDSGSFQEGMWDHEFALPPPSPPSSSASATNATASPSGGTVQNAGAANGHENGNGTPHRTPPPHTFAHFRLEQGADVEVFAPDGGYQELVFNYSTGALSVSPFRTDPGEVPFPLPFNNWVGVFHYDYVAERFTEFDLRLKVSAGN